MGMDLLTSSLQLTLKLNSLQLTLKLNFMMKLTPFFRYLQFYLNSYNVIYQRKILHCAGGIL